MGSVDGTHVNVLANSSTYIGTRTERGEPKRTPASGALSLSARSASLVVVLMFCGFEEEWLIGFVIGVEGRTDKRTQAFGAV